MKKHRDDINAIQDAATRGQLSPQASLPDELDTLGARHVSEEIPLPPPDVPDAMRAEVILGVANHLARQQRGVLRAEALAELDHAVSAIHSSASWLT